MDDFGNDLANAFPILGSGSLSGSIETSGDLDVFEVTLAAGQKISIDVTPTGFDPLESIVVQIFDASQAIIDAEASLDLNDPTNISFIAPVAGTYYIQVEGGFTLTPGQLATGGYSLNVLFDAPFNDVHGDNESIATPVIGDATFNAEIHNADDFDLFLLDLTAGDRVSASATSRLTGDPLEVVGIAVSDLSANVLAIDAVVNIGEVARVDFTAPSTGAYIFAVTGSPSQAGLPLAAGDYTVSFDFISVQPQPEADFTAEISNFLAPTDTTDGEVTFLFQNVGDLTAVGTVRIMLAPANGQGVSDPNAEELVRLPSQFVFAGQDLSITVAIRSLSDVPSGDYVIIVDVGESNDSNPGNDQAVSTPFTVTDQTLIIGTNVGETITGTDNANTIDALAGNDRVNGLDGDDLIYGGEGLDSLGGAAGNDTIFGGARDDTIRAGDGDDIIDGGTFSDVIFGDAGNDTIFGGQGNDVLLGRVGDDLLYGGTNRDNLVGEGGNDTIFGGDDFDTVNGGDGADLLYGGDFPDQMRGGIDGDTLFGGGSNDLMFGDAGNDTLFGGVGQDNMLGGDGDDTLDGGDDRDKLAGGIGNDTMFGGQGADRISGESGNDTIFGGSENDLVFAGDGNDSVESGAGRDVVLGKDGDDSIAGGTEDDKLYGEAGFDVLYGGDGIDFLFGGSEADEIYGGNDRDIIRTGSGQDMAFGGDGDDNIRGEGDDDMLAAGRGNDFLLGEGGNDMLDGGADNDRVDGGLGDDSIFGAGGNDSLMGNVGNDVVYGGDGDDLVRGGVGNDTLDGGFGNDTLIGEDGDDVFVFLPGSGTDTVLGFGGGDLLQVASVDIAMPVPPVITQLTVNQWQVEVEGNTILVRTNPGETIDLTDIQFIDFNLLL